MDWEKCLNPFPEMDRGSRADEILLTLRDRIHAGNWSTGSLWSRFDRGCLLGHVGNLAMPDRNPVSLSLFDIISIIRANPDFSEAMEILATVCIRKRSMNWVEELRHLKERGGWTAEAWCHCIASFNDTRNHVDEIQAILEDARLFMADRSGLRYYDHYKYRRMLAERESLPSFTIIAEGGTYPPLAVKKKVEPDPAERVEVPSWDPDAELADLLKDKELVAAYAA